MKYANAGRDLFGRPVHVPITELSSLIAGLPGSGKSSLLRVIAAEASFESDIAIITIDPKRVELGAWKPRATAHVTVVDDIIGVFRQVVALIEARTSWLEENELEAWPAIPTAPNVLLLIDELAEISHSGDRNDDARSILLRRILSLGRAAGVNVVAATQRPDAQVLPTYVRSLFSYGIGFRLRGPEDARMVIPGISADMSGPHRLPAGDAHRGRAFVQVADELDPIECRVTWCDPATARSLAKANAHLRPAFDLGEFSAAEGAPTSSYDRAVPAEDELIIGLLEAGAQSYQSVAEAVGITADAARRRLTRLEQAGRVQHAAGSPVWALT